MSNFTTILNRGKRKFIDKHLKKRMFGKCEACDRPDLLIQYAEPALPQKSYHLCNHCYTEMVNNENDK
jgi:hypothetical protein